MRTECFGQQVHGELREENRSQAKPKRNLVELLSQIGRDARAEQIGQRGEEEMERTGEF